jgi:hypothetical protein
LRILFSDNFFCNFSILKYLPPNFSFQVSSENTLSRILPILRKLVGKVPVGVLELWKLEPFVSALVNKVLLLKTCALGFVFDCLVKVSALVNVDP